MCTSKSNVTIGVVSEAYRTWSFQAHPCMCADCIAAQVQLDVLEFRLYARNFYVTDVDLDHLTRMNSEREPHQQLKAEIRMAPHVNMQ